MLDKVPLLAVSLLDLMNYIKKQFRILFHRVIEICKHLILKNIMPKLFLTCLTYAIINKNFRYKFRHILYNMNAKLATDKYFVVS